MCFVCNLTFCNSSYLPLWFEGRTTLVLIASVPGHCLPMTMISLFNGRTLPSESMCALVFVYLCVFKLFSEPTGPSKGKFHVEPQWDRGKIYSFDSFYLLGGAVA